MLKVISVGKHFHTEMLFAGVQFVLNPGDRIGLVGPNGAGKSTLLRILVGDEPPSVGRVTLAPRATLGYSAQQVADPSLTVGSFLDGGLGEVQVVSRRMAELEPSLDNPAALRDYGHLQERWLALQGWTAATRLAQVREQLDLTHLSADAPLGSVSGGEQARLTLARVLLATPDLLILDEPTNHLDADGAGWLSAWLASFPGGVLVVSHDRAFLDASVTRIVELDGIHEAPQWYEGGYSAYRVEKDRRWERYLLDYEAQEKQRRRWEADIEATKGHALGVELTIRARGADHARRIAKKVAKKAKVRERLLERRIASMRWLAEPETRPPLVLAFRSDPAPLEASDLTVKLGGRTLLADLSVRFAPGERVLLSGRNGAGKTTLLSVLAGRLAPDGGTVTGPAQLLPQTHDSIRTGITVLDYFRSQVPVYVDEAEALLTAYQFGSQEWDSPLRTLSAGELRRLLLAVMVNSGAQVLLLDEPTNYLDFDALDVVEEALRMYRGTLIMVTHDTYFADRVGVTRRLTLDGTLRESGTAHD